MHTSTRVLQRFMQSYDVTAEERFRPPKWLVEGVDSGEMTAECLNVWKYVVTSLADHFDYAAATKYWRNKCLKMGYSIPQKFLEGGGGEGATGPWRVKSGEEVEEWVKQTLRSKGLLSDLGNTEHDWLLEIDHLVRLSEEAQERVDKHLGAIAGGKGNAQRQKWLAGASKDLVAHTAELMKAKDALGDLRKTAARYEAHKSPTIEFEKEFQFMLLLAAKDFDKKTILDAMQKAVKRFEEGLEIPGPAPDPAKYEGYKQAGLLDWISDVLVKAKDYLANAFHAFTDWVSGLLTLQKKLDKMLTAAGA